MTYQDIAGKYLGKYVWPENDDSQANIRAFASHLSAIYNEPTKKGEEYYTAGLAGEISNCHAQSKSKPDKPSITYSKGKQECCEPSFNEYGSLFRYPDGTYAVSPTRKAIIHTPLGQSRGDGLRLVSCEITLPTPKKP